MARRPLPAHLDVPWKISETLLTFAAAWIVLPIIIVLLLGAIGPSLPAAKELLNNLVSGNVYANFGLVLIDAVAALLLVRHYLTKYHKRWSDVGWRGFNIWKTLILLLVIFGVFIIAVAVVFALVTWLVPGFNATQTQSNDFTGAAAAQHRSVSLLALVIIPPIIEETVFRGFIFPALAKRWGLLIGAVLTSLLFGIAHLQANVSIYTFILSLLLCFMYWRLKSIIPGIALHMLNNYLAYIALTGGR